MIEKPIRKYLKQKDYQKHKILRRIKKRNQRRKEAASKIAERALRKKLKLPAFEGGKDEDELLNAGELPDVTVMPRRIANKSWDKVQERWVGDMPTYYAVNPETGKEEMLREIGNGKYSTYDDKHVFDVLGAEAAKKEREQWIRNGGNAGDFDKVMLGTLGLGLAPIALPEIAAGVSTALANPYVDAGLTSYFGAHGLNHAINEGIDGWGDAAMTALELTPLGRLARPMYNAGKEAVYNIADRYMFMPHQNSFTRGIGGEAGLQDLIESGLVRGNPVGTETTAKAYGKLTRSNRNNFNDIMRDTGLKDIEHRFYNRTLTEEDFNAIKKAALKYKTENPSLGSQNKITLLRPDVDPLSRYSSYQDYQAKLASDRQTLANATSLDDSGQPLAYFYDNGRNPLTAGHDYAASDYGVRINNASEYNPRIFEGHLHYSMPKAVPLRDPNVEIFGKGPLGLTVKLDKETLQPLWKKDLSNIFKGNKVISPHITAENAASMTPEQWTAAQDAAIARGDMTEAQRLRDLHFQVSAPNTVTSVNGQPLQLYHGTNNTFNAFDLSKYGSTDGGTFGRGVYTTPVKEYAELYGKNNMPLYMKLDNPRDYRNSSIGDLMAEKLAFGDDFATGNGIDGVIGRPSWKGFKGLEEYVSHNPKNIKSSFPITYDDKGVRIPLGERDNFNINDIRYGLIPFGTGLTGYGLYNSITDPIISSYNKGKDPIHIKPSKRGTFTAAAKKRGIGVLLFASKVLRNPSNYSSAMRKKALFAKNATKFKH